MNEFFVRYRLFPCGQRQLIIVFIFQHGKRLDIAVKQMQHFRQNGRGEFIQLQRMEHQAISVCAFAVRVEINRSCFLLLQYEKDDGSVFGENADVFNRREIVIRKDGFCFGFIIGFLG